MSQNKTKFPGMENTGNNPYNRDAFNPNVEAAQYRGKSKQTRYPNMEDMGNVEPEKEEDQHDPIVGFLFSVSRTPFGEYWPLYVGKNTIGRDEENSSVYLREGSVSGDHAILVIQQFTNPDMTYATLKDNGSKTGTFINKKPLVFGQSETCKNGDILRFGGSYECMLILFDVREVGLKQAENFIKVEAGEMEEEEIDFNPPYRPGGGETRTGDQSFNPIQRGGTSAMDGGPMFGGPKHKTEIM